MLCEKTDKHCNTVKMACVDKIPRANEESEMEEGEIVDDLDDLSDISSEEEFLLRQRLEVLENYNNVLERKKAKHSSRDPGKKSKRDVLCDLSEISAAELEESHCQDKKSVIVQRPKPSSKQKRKKDSQYIDENNVRRKRDGHKKKISRSRKKLGVTVLSETSESEDEYRNKRKKLAEAVIVHRGADKTSLSARLHKMINWSETHIISELENRKSDTTVRSNHINLTNEILSPVSSGNDDPILVDDVDCEQKVKNKILESIEVSTDDDVKIISDAESKTSIENKPHNANMMCQEQLDKDSDEDLEVLRQHALKSKPIKPQANESNKTDQKPLSEDEDSDTAELRIICLKSALLKKAIEMKRKQKMQKKLSQTSNLEDDLINDCDLLTNKEADNNTDIESVDMDMESDAEEKAKEGAAESEKKNNAGLPNINQNNDMISSAMNINTSSKEDELDDDEDLLRAKLLTSLSKNLTNLVSPEVLKTIEEVKNVDSPQTAAKPANVPEAKKFIIKLDESDSEGEHEATKNLTKMHMKLSEQLDFQQKLDLFLKSTRLEVEKTKLPDVVQQEPTPRKPTKFVAKAVNNLPKSEQLEYKNLVKRMAELEKMKQTRQASLNLLNKQNGKDTLRPRNVTIDSQAAINIEEQIAKSRKTIADESAKMLKLKEEATKLSHRYKIAATELRNISTAITLNKKQQRAVQISLSKIRQQHQSLLMSSTSLHSKVNNRIPHLSHLSDKVLSNKLQKENNPKKEYKDPVVQKTVKVSVVNDLVDESTINNPRLSIQLDVTSNKKVVKIPKSPDSERGIEVDMDTANNQTTEVEKMEVDRLFPENDSNVSNRNEQDSRKLTTKPKEMVKEYDQGNQRNHISTDDYKSPLDAFGSNTWQADPNAILCPFEVGGQCKDPDCKYLHTPTSQ